MEKRRVIVALVALLAWCGQALAQRGIMVFDPELHRPVEGMLVWADHGEARQTNVFGEVVVPEKLDTLTLSKAGYVTLHIPARWVADSIPVIRDAGGIGEVTVYGVDRSGRVAQAARRWSREEKTEYALRHPITGIGFNIEDVFSPKRQKQRRARKRLMKVFRRLDADDSNPIIQSYRRAME